jgi:hypothetical protein
LHSICLDLLCFYAAYVAHFHGSDMPVCQRMH